MIWCVGLTWLSTYQAKTIIIGLFIVALCIGGYILMDKNKNENFVVMKRNAKGQFQKAEKSVEVSLDTKSENLSEIPSDAKPEKEIKRTPPMPSMAAYDDYPEDQRRTERVVYRESESRRPKFSLSDYFSRSPATNGDKIRAMNDDELAEFLADVERGELIKLWLKQKD